MDGFVYTHVLDHVIEDGCDWGDEDWSVWYCLGSWWVCDMTGNNDSRLDSELVTGPEMLILYHCYDVVNEFPSLSCQACIFWSGWRCMDLYVLLCLVYTTEYSVLVIKISVDTMKHLTITHDMIGHCFNPYMYGDASINYLWFSWITKLDYCCGIIAFRNLS